MAKIVMNYSLSSQPQARLIGFLEMTTPPGINLSGNESGVYAILNIKNGKGYIGSSLHVTDRMQAHKKDLKENRHCNRFLQRAFNKENQVLCGGILERIKRIAGESDSDFDSRVRKAEQLWIDKMRSADRMHGYNLNPKADVPPNLKGHKFSEETCRKKAITHKRLYQEHLSQGGERRKCPMEGKKHSPLAIQKMRESTLRQLRERGHWATGLNKETHPGIARTSQKAIGNKRGQKYSDQLRQEIIRNFLNGDSVKFLTEKYGCSKCSINVWVRSLRGKTSVN